jgi:hypothetical protein
MPLVIRTMGPAAGETRFLKSLFAQQASDGRAIVKVEFVEVFESRSVCVNFVRCQVSLYQNI